MTPESFRDHYDIFPEAILLIAPDGTIVAANRAARKQLPALDREHPDGGGLVGASLFAAVERAASGAETRAAAGGAPCSESAGTAITLAAFKRYLKSCSQSRVLVIGTLPWRGCDGESREYRCEGVRVGAEVGGPAPLLLLRVRTKARAAAPFSRLRDHVDLISRQQRQRQLVKELERRVAERTSALERSNAELQRFAYVASHDLQEPLRMVASYAGLLRARYGGQLDERADKYLNYTVDGAERMQALIRDLLTYARVETRATVARGVNLDRVVDEVLHHLEAAIGEAGADITRDDLPMLEIDAAQFRQLYQNLIGNAIKFRGEAAPAVHLGAKRAGDEWILSVADNGIGIEPDYSARIFQMFQRLHDRDRYPGTGIGLAIVKRVAERHGGRVWVESEPGAGACFYIAVPAALEAG